MPQVAVASNLDASVEVTELSFGGSPNAPGRFVMVRINRRLTAAASRIKGSIDGSIQKSKGLPTSFWDAPAWPTVRPLACGGGLHLSRFAAKRIRVGWSNFGQFESPITRRGRATSAATEISVPIRGVFSSAW